MHRLFVAIQPPAALRRQLLATMGGVQNARWQTDEQLHLTLRFIGEVDRHQAEDIAAALGAVHHPAFEIALDTVGQFDRRGRVESLWIGVRPHDPLRALHKRVDQALARVGIAAEGRAYLPHITLARFSRAAGPVGNLVAHAATVGGMRFGVRDICLYESHLSHEGSSYDVIARYPLDAEDAAANA